MKNNINKTGYTLMSITIIMFLILTLIINLGLDYHILYEKIFIFTGLLSIPFLIIIIVNTYIDMWEGI